MKRRIIVLFLVLLLALTQSVSVWAEEFDEAQLGSISVTLTDNRQNRPIVGAELSIYRVGTVVADELGNLIYDFTEEFQGVSGGVDDPNLVAKLEEFLLKNDLDSEKITTDDKGTALCEALPLGLYFVKQTGKVEGFAPCKPFLVTLPGESSDGFLYDVIATPKTEVERLTKITVKKVWNTDVSAKTAESVTVQLLKDGKVVKTAILNSKNNWQITYDNMPESDAYSVKEVDPPKGFTATVKQDGYVFTVINTPNLAQTGQLIWPIPLLVIGGVLLISAGVVLLFKKRKTNA